MAEGARQALDHFLAAQQTPRSPCALPAPRREPSTSPTEFATRAPRLSCRQPAVSLRSPPARRRALTPEDLADAAPAPAPTRPRTGMPSDRRLARGHSPGRPGPEVLAGLEIEHHRRWDERNRPDRRRAAEPTLLEPAHHPIGGAEPNALPRSAAPPSALRVRKRRQRLDLSRARAPPRTSIPPRVPGGVMTTVHPVCAAGSVQCRP